MTPININHSTNIYIISGPCGVGKSSVSRELAKKFKLSSHINGDDLYHMVVGGNCPPWKDDGTYLNLLWTNINSIVENFIINGFISVIDYVVFPDDLKFIKTLKDKHGVEVKYVVLMANEDIIKSRDIGRSPNSIMGERALDLLEEFKQREIDNKFIINTSCKSISETINILINDDRFLI